MSDGDTPAFVVLYRWRIRHEREAEFVEAWSRLTRRLHDEQGSLGARLHRGADGIWYAYAQWPSREQRERAFANLRDPEADEAFRRATIERLPEIVLAPVAGALD